MSRTIDYSCARHDLQGRVATSFDGLPTMPRHGVILELDTQQVPMRLKKVHTAKASRQAASLGRSPLGRRRTRSAQLRAAPRPRPTLTEPF